MTASLREVPPAGSRWVAGLQRRMVQGLLKPALDPRHPIEHQRRRADLLGGLQPLAWGVRREADARGEWLRPRVAEAAGSLLYLHGGAYCIGSPRSHRALTTRIARATCRPVYVLDYRLAPEHPWPAALQDAIAAFHAMPGPVVIAGDSAGGGLALLTALALRDRGGPQPAALWLMSPWVDLAPWPAPPPGEAMLSDAWGQACATHVLGGQPRQAMSPLHHDLHGLPRVLLQFGTDEALHDQGRALHDALARAEVPVQTEVFARRWHVFQLHAGQLRSADDALASAVDFLRHDR